jgi:hypothetical protein
VVIDVVIHDPSVPAAPTNTFITLEWRDTSSLTLPTAAKSATRTGSDS